MKKTNFVQGDLVKIKDEGDLGVKLGKVCGLSTAELPILGRGYIIEILDGDIPNVCYPFTHVCTFEVFMIKVENTEKKA